MDFCKRAAATILVMEKKIRRCTDVKPFKALDNWLKRLLALSFLSANLAVFPRVIMAIVPLRIIR